MYVLDNFMKDYTKDNYYVFNTVLPLARAQQIAT